LPTRPGIAAGASGSPKTRSSEGGDAGFGLIEVMVALTVLAVIFSSIGWLIVSSLSSAELAKQRSTAAGIVQLVDTQLQNNVPNQVGLVAAEAYVSGMTSASVINNPNTQSTNYTVSTAYAPVASTKLLAVTITVSWKSAIASTTVVSISGQTKVAYS
jgi:prepilin-type N-terminal cleavage/methylation domain-containing protein